MNAVASDKSGRAFARARRLFRAKIDQDGTATSAVPCPNIIENVADKPRTGQVEIEIRCRLQDHSRLRFTTLAAYAQLWNDAFRMMGAVIYTVEEHAATFKFAPQILVHGLQIRLGKVSARDARLISDHDQPEACFLQRLQFRANTIIEL